VAGDRTLRPLKLAVVLWGGFMGGAETLSVAITEHMKGLGATVTVVFVQGPLTLKPRLSRTGIEHRSIGLKRGRDVLRHPRRYAREVAWSGPDGALLIECGFMGAALRAGGYRAPIVATEHGVALGLRDLTRRRRTLWRLSRASGAWADDVEVAVSDYLLSRMRRYPHSRRLTRIYNGIDPAVYHPAGDAAATARTLIVGFAGRLIPGKGADHLIEAVARARDGRDLKLVIAGHGSERPRLESLTEVLAIDHCVEFLGAVDDSAGFWRSCDIAVVPSDRFVESFSMSTLEAMASGCAVIATRNGAIPELMSDGVTGTLVDPGDIDALAQAMVSYAENHRLMQAHATAARARAVERFDVKDCARAYLDLFTELALSRRKSG